jgi:hypothetical protein
MDGLEFAADLVAALAWPVAMVAIVFLLKEPIEKAIDILAEWLAHKTRYKP